MEKSEKCGLLQISTSKPYYLSKSEFESGEQGFMYFDMETGEFSFKEKVKLFSKTKKD